MSDVLTIVAHVRAKLGQESSALEILRALIAPTRAEAGCINYDLHQSADDPALFVFYENWASVKDFEAHGRSAHIQKFRQNAAACLAEGPVISKWKIVTQAILNGSKARIETDEIGGVAIERASLADIDGIVALAKENGPKRGGELSVRLGREAVLARMQGLPSVVARREGRVIGFLLASNATASSPPIVEAMLRAYSGTEGAYVYGPVCVDRAERGHGLAAAMFAELRQMLPGREGILFIKADNEPSLRAHRKMGMRQVAEFIHDGVALVIFSYTG